VETNSCFLEIYLGGKVKSFRSQPLPD